jgi:NAD(P)-dependent dehydrogenase (short-subunit alcohol dehydrogenase family)
MEDVLGYAGRRVVVTGAASGMGENVAFLCQELGASVTALDVNPVTVPVASTMTLDLLDPVSIASVADAIQAPIDAIFSCAGLPGPPFTDVQVATANFVGARDLIRRLAPKMSSGAAVACIASAAGIGWRNELERYAPLHATTTFEDAVEWLQTNPDAFPMGGYRNVEGSRKPICRARVRRIR